MTTLSVTLDEDLRQFVEQSVQSGDFHSASELVAVAITHLRNEETAHQEELEFLRREVGIGIAQAEAGDFVEFDAEQVIAEAQTRRAAKTHA